MSQWVTGRERATPHPANKHSSRRVGGTRLYGGRYTAWFSPWYTVSVPRLTCIAPASQHTPIPLAGSVEKHWLIPGPRSPGRVLPAPTTLARSLPTLLPLKPHTNSEPVNLTHTQLRSRTLESVKHSCSESPE